MQIGIIGCGKQAPKHISGLLANGVERIVVADVNPDFAQKLASNYEAGQVVAAASADDIFCDDKVAGVSICTPTPFHAPLIRSALASGKHYLCEKPVCDTLEEAEELVGLTEASGLVGMVGFIYRYAPVFERTLEMMGGQAGSTSEVFGSVSNAFFRIGGRGSAAAWKHRRETGGGALNEMLVHMVDLSQWFFGKATSVRLIDAKLRWPERVIGGEPMTADAEDFVLVQVTTEHGVDVLFEADLITPGFIQYTEVQGTNANFVGSIQGDFSNFIHVQNPTGELKAGRSDLSYPQANLYKNQMGEFVSAIGQGSPTRCPVSNSVEVMRTMSELRRQLQEGFGF